MSEIRKKCNLFRKLCKAFQVVINQFCKIKPMDNLYLKIKTWKHCRI